MVHMPQSQWMMVWAAVMLCGPARALEYAGDCYLTGADGEKVGFYAQDIGNGFVTYWLPGARAGYERVVLEHCPSTERLMAEWDGDADESNAALRKQWTLMIEGEAQFTLPQIAASLRSLGAKTSLRRTGVESCPCRLAATGDLGHGAYQPDVLP